MSNLTSWYQQQTQTGKLSFDPAQLKLLTQLDTFLNKFSNLNFITRLWRKDHKLGYYIYGDVGRGKSMIMNIMYEFTSGTRKRRLHFHEFMHEIHQQLALQSNIDDPLNVIVKNLKQQYDIIYLDEMHVSDIATAMIMKRLLEVMFDNKIYVVTSSNYHPDQLWPNGLMRERFLPAIEVIKDRLEILSLNSQQDYRLINNSVNQLFIAQNQDSDNKLNEIFNLINLDNQINSEPLKICNRDLPCIKSGLDIIWFNFSIICGDQRSQLDYLELIKTYKWIIISNITQLTESNKDIARRFTWLVDILYDNSTKLAFSSAIPFQDIYSRGDFANEFERTISRLEEMQTNEYLEKNLTAHKS